MWIVVLASSVLLIYFDTVGTVATFVTEEHILGSNIELDCQVTSDDLYWKCPYGRTIYDDSNSIDDRPYKNGSKLKIINIQMEDRGIYKCLKNDIIEKQFNVTIPALVTSENPSYYRNLKIDHVKQILVAGSMNQITVFDLSSKSVPVKSTSADIQPSSDNVNNCRLSHSVTPYCQNHFRILGKKTDNTFLVCGTNGDSPTGYEFNITDGSYTETGHVPCSNDPFHNSTSVFVEFNNTDDKPYMYYGSVNYNDKTIQRPVYGTNDYMKGVDRSRWFQDPEFVGSFDLSDEVLFFFREKAIEVDPTNERIYSRVAKVCKKDVGGNTQLRNKWTSYQKARLICSITGDYTSYFDIIEDVQTADGITFYGLFTSGNTDVSDSAICAFSLSDIQMSFNGAFKHQPNSDSFWVPIDTNLSPRPGQCVDNSLDLTDDILQFIADKPLMNGTVNSQTGKPLFIMEQETFQKLELHDNMTELVFYVASNRGKIYKLLLKESVMYFVSNYSVWDLSDQSPVLWSLQQHGDFLYVGTDHSIQQIKIINCEKYLWVDSCVRDPHCAWINNTNILPQNGNICRNRCRPLSYVQTNGYLNENGIFTHTNSDLEQSTPLTCPPSPPTFVRSIKASTEEIYLEWINGDDGGYRQSFVIEYRQESANEWQIQIDVRTLPTTSNSVHRCSIAQSLYPGKSYELRVLSMNVIGNSSYTSPIYLSTKVLQVSNPAEETPLNFGICVIIGVIIGVVIGMIICVVIHLKCTVLANKAREKNSITPSERISQKDTKNSNDNRNGKHSVREKVHTDEDQLKGSTKTKEKTKKKKKKTKKESNEDQNGQHSEIEQVSKELTNGQQFPPIVCITTNENKKKKKKKDNQSKEFYACYDNESHEKENCNEVAKF